MNNYRLIESRNTKYVVCETEAVAVGVINGQLDLCHCDANNEDADIGEDGGMTCPAHAALNVIDLAGLNTTANDLRAQLTEANAGKLRIAHESVAKNERITFLESQLAEANRTIEELRDTLNDKQATAWDDGNSEGYGTGMAYANGYYRENKKNPYR